MIRVYLSIFSSLSNNYKAKDLNSDLNLRHPCENGVNTLKVYAVTFAGRFVQTNLSISQIINQREEEKYIASFVKKD